MLFFFLVLLLGFYGEVALIRKNKKTVLIVHLETWANMNGSFA